MERAGRRTAEGVPGMRKPKMVSLMSEEAMLALLAAQDRFDHPRPEDAWRLLPNPPNKIILESTPHDNPLLEWWNAQT